MKRQENRAVIAWREAASAGLVSSADRAYMELPSLARLRDKMSRTCGHTHEKADGLFSQNRNGREAILGLSRLDYPSAKPGETVNGGAFIAPFILTVDWLSWLCYFFNS